ncbi:hypothetical protein AB0K60_28980 [Thermopolyspora sp. NPDC052614]|uniref:hypothetical protein n=1 Tax=Thermopolyspora sp. NPDC052614 TaxID=3155682 RepID=UPI00341FC723
MSLEGVDYALNLRRTERDRISNDLLDLEGHSGHQLLKGAELSGATQRRWEETRTRLATLWWLFDAYRKVVEEAERLRAERSRPGAEALAELNRLLTGASVELKPEDVPVERRSLVRAVGERITLDEVVARMDAAYQEVARAVAAADDAWTALLPKVEEADAARRAAENLLTALGGADPELERLGRELADLRQLVRGDPLSFVSGDAVDVSALERVGAALAARRDHLEHAVRVRDGFDARVRAMRDRVAAVRAAEDEARAARDRVLVKIDSPVLPHLPDQAAALENRLAALRATPAAGDWSEVARRVADLERALADALRQAREATQAINALLERRDELRGRLEAFRAKALRQGIAEHPELLRLFRQARDLLWTAPCDLRQATRAVSGYQRALRAIGAD